MLVLDTAVSWQAVALALIAALPGIIAAWRANAVVKAIKTPSKTPIGEQLEAAHHVALANNYRLQVLSGEANGPEVTAARKVEHESVPKPPPHERRGDTPAP